VFLLRKRGLGWFRLGWGILGESRCVVYMGVADDDIGIGTTPSRQIDDFDDDV
jgi:hypothetical protein